MKAYLALRLSHDIFKDFSDVSLASAYFKYVLGLNFPAFATYTHIAALSGYHQRPAFWSELVRGDLVELEAAAQVTREVDTLLAHGLIEEVQT